MQVYSAPGGRIRIYPWCMSWLWKSIPYDGMPWSVSLNAGVRGLVLNASDFADSHGSPYLLVGVVDSGSGGDKEG